MAFVFYGIPAFTVLMFVVFVNGNNSYDLCCQSKNGLSCSTCSSQLCRQMGGNETCLSDHDESGYMLAPGDCFIDKNQSDCSSLNFNEGGDYNARALGVIRLDRVLSDGATNLNISFINIKWNRMDLRLSGKDVSWTLCRSLQLSRRVREMRQGISAHQLFYDCRLLDGNMNGRDLLLEYRASDAARTETGSLTFRLDPPADDLVSDSVWTQKMVYIEWQPPTLTARWHQEAANPPAFYQVSVIRDGTLQTRETVPSTTSHPDLGFAYSYDTARHPGSYVFEVSSCEDQGECGPASSSASIKIAPVSRVPQFISLLVLLLQWLTVLVSLWLAAQWYGALSGKPTVLIIYSPSRNLHVKVVQELAAFLRDHCRFNILLDIEDIPRSNKGPPVWYAEALTSSDAVLVVASPPPPGVPDGAGKLQPNVHLEPGAGGIFVDLDLLGMRLLSSSLASRKLRIVVCQPAGTTARCLPPELRPFTGHRLPGGLSGMLRSLRGIRMLPPCLPPPPGAERSAAVLRAPLLAALRAAELDLEERPPAPGAPSPWERPEAIRTPTDRVVPKEESKSNELSEIVTDLWSRAVPGQRLGDGFGSKYPGPIESAQLLGPEEPDVDNCQKDPESPPPLYAKVDPFAGMKL